MQLEVDVKPIIIPWEEITHNTNRIGLGYTKDILDVSFNILVFSKLIQFWSTEFLEGVVPEQVDRCQ